MAKLIRVRTRRTKPVAVTPPAPRVFGVEPVMEPIEIQRVLRRLEKLLPHTAPHTKTGRMIAILYFLCEEQHRRSARWAAKRLILEARSMGLPILEQRTREARKARKRP